MADDLIAVVESEHAHIQDLFDRVSQPDEDRRDVFKRLLLELSAHVGAEKRVVRPALDDGVDGGDELARGLGEDHDEIERLITLLERRKVNSPDVPDLANELLAVVDRHVERSGALLSALRTALDDGQLDELGAAMQGDDAKLLTHPHPHLPDTGPLAKLTRGAAALVDRTRDSSADVGRSAT